jgi:DNA invertase Pin-like site-specific DNA recombinase
MKLGYARVSTEDQRLDLQRARLTEAGCGRLFEEKISGAARRRPMLEQALREMRADDILVVTRLDRLARSTTELLSIAETIAGKSAGLQSLDEPWADTTTPAGRMVLTVFAGVAEFERALIRHRTDEGNRPSAAVSRLDGRQSYVRIRRRSRSRWSRKAAPSARSPEPSMCIRLPSTAASISFSPPTTPYDSTPSRSDARAWEAPHGGKVTFPERRSTS